MIDAYSHECASGGFWPGDGLSAAPVFYAYAYPEPPGYASVPVVPAVAGYDRNAREFLLPYEKLRAIDHADAALLNSFRSTYLAAATRGAWDQPALER